MLKTFPMATRDCLSSVTQTARKTFDVHPA